MNYYAIPGIPVKAGLDLNTLAAIVSDYYLVPFAKVVSGSRLKDIVKARHVFCYMARTEGKMTLHRIADFINRDHTSVMHGVKQVQIYKGNEKEIVNDLAEISVRIKRERCKRF